jgi:hypothetical protein
MTIAKQLNIKTFPFEIKDSDGNQIYWENSKGYWGKWEWVDGKVIRWEDSNGLIVDYRPKKTDVQKAIDLLTKEGLLRNGKILKN